MRPNAPDTGKLHPLFWGLISQLSYTFTQFTHTTSSDMIRWHSSTACSPLRNAHHRRPRSCKRAVHPHDLPQWAPPVHDNQFTRTASDCHITGVCGDCEVGEPLPRDRHPLAGFAKQTPSIGQHRRDREQLEVSCAARFDQQLRTCTNHLRVSCRLRVVASKTWPPYCSSA